MAAKSNKSEQRYEAFVKRGLVEGQINKEALYIKASNKNAHKVWVDLIFCKNPEELKLKVSELKIPTDGSCKSEMFCLSQNVENNEIVKLLPSEDVDKFRTSSALQKLLGRETVGKLTYIPYHEDGGYDFSRFYFPDGVKLESVRSAQAGGDEPEMPDEKHAEGPGTCSPSQQQRPSPQERLRKWAGDLGLTLPSASRPCFNLILEGVPGTGKTFSLSELRKRAVAGPHHAWMAEWGQGRFAMTMHPATAYEDFVEGLRPGDPPLPGWSKDWDGCQTNPRVYRAHDDGMAASAGGTRNDSSDGDQDVKERWFFTSTTARATASDSAPQSGQEPARAGFSIHNGFFVRVCDEAVHFPDRIFVVLLDEINRCNIPKVMGDLLTTLEPSKRAKWSEVDGHWDISKAQTVTLPYSQRTFFVPDNVVVVGTMNTTDRSVAPMDAALRRRFAFARVHPQGFGAKGLGNGEEKNPPEALVTGVDDRNAYALETSWKLWKALNTALQQFGDDAMLGHSYLWDLKEALEGVDNHEEVWKITESRWNLFILPQLVDVLVSNDLVDEVLAVKDGKTGGVQFNDYIHTELRGTGLLRVPMFSVKGEKFKQPDASAEAQEGTPLNGTQNSDAGDTGAVPPES